MKSTRPTRRTFLLSSAAFGLHSSFARSAPAGSSVLHQRGVVSDALKLSSTNAVTINGWAGDKINACITHRVMAQDASTLVLPFQQHSDTDDGWRGEFWGKWFTSAVLAYQYQPTAEHKAVLDDAVRLLLATQSPAGDISTYDVAHRCGNWDVWTRKYVLLGLIAYYDQTSSSDALKAATRVGDTVLRDFGLGKENIQDASLSFVAGLSSCSVLEPICLLYQRTKEQRFLNYAEYIVASWKQPSHVAPHGMQLLRDALKKTPPTGMVAPKAYEMMSCFEGVCELYRITGDRLYLDAVRQFAETIRHTERMVNGGASNQELWCRGAVTQTAVLEQPQETCVTTTWMKLCAQLLRLTGDPVWADEIELSFYNALAGAQTPGGSWWSYFSPLIGQRVPSLPQYEDLKLSCCVANGPRSLLLIPRLSVMEDSRGITANLYAPGSYGVRLPDGTAATVVQTTDYPRNGTVSIAVHTETQTPFTLSLRVPAWSRKTTLTVNGTEISCPAGLYARVRRIWKPEDRVELTLDMRGRAVQSPASEDQLAVMRGPILLALDNRLTPSREVDVWLSADKDGYIALQPSTETPSDVWMSFDVPFEVKPYHFFQHHIETLRMCDYASAGNAWSDENLYKTWLPQPMYLNDAYASGTWKIMYPAESKRPTIPKAV
jgi:DUF1680 family protein